MGPVAGLTVLRFRIYAHLAVPEGLDCSLRRLKHQAGKGTLCSGQLFCLPRLVVSSLEALESCFAVGPIIEKAVTSFKAHGSAFLKRQEVMEWPGRP